MRRYCACRPFGIAFTALPWNGTEFAVDNDMIDGLNNSGSLPVMQKVVQFAAGRHSLIADNVANISTPGFRPVDVSLEEFQSALEMPLKGVVIAVRNDSGLLMSIRRRPSSSRTSKSPFILSPWPKT